MINFDVRLIPEFDTKSPVYKLVRSGKVLLDDFWEEVSSNKNMVGERDELIAVIKDVANNKPLPSKRYRQLKLSKNLSYSGYEAKSKHLRLYFLKENNTGLILIFGGTKKSQSKDLKRLEAIIKDYTQYKTSK